MKKYPEAGSLVEIWWEDIQESSVGDPETAETAERISYGIYLGKKRKGRRWYITTTSTLEGWESRKYGDQSGWCSYPVGAIEKIVTIREPSKEEPK